MAEGFCTQCGKQIESFESLDRCPFCKTTSVPCALKNQVDININTHELQILCMWAEKHLYSVKDEQMQASMSTTLRSICNRISKQLPEKRKINLLICDEVKDLKKEFGDENIESNILDI